MKKKLGKFLSLLVATMLMVGTFGMSSFADTMNMSLSNEIKNIYGATVSFQVNYSVGSIGNETGYEIWVSNTNGNNPHLLVTQPALQGTGGSASYTVTLAQIKNYFQGNNKRVTVKAKRNSNTLISKYVDINVTDGYDLIINIDPSSSGRVKVNPEGPSNIYYVTSSSTEYVKKSGDTTLEAIDLSGYTFSAWSGESSLLSRNIISSNHTGSATYTANFTPDSYDISLNPPANGTLVATVNPVMYPGITRITATAEEGYKLVGQPTIVGLYAEIDQGSSIGPSGDVTEGWKDIRPLEDLTVTVFTEMIPTYMLSVDVSENEGLEGNAVSFTLRSSTGIEYPVDSGYYTEGSVFDLNVDSVGPEYGFAHWEFDTDPASMVNGSSVVLIGDTSVIGVFEKEYYLVMTEPNIVGRGTTIATTDTSGMIVIDHPEQTVALKSHSVTVTATPATGHFFKKWINKDGGATVSTDELYTYTPMGDMELIAVFDTNPDITDPFAPNPAQQPQPEPEEEPEPEVPIEEPEPEPEPEPEVVPEDELPEGEVGDGVEEVVEEELPEATPGMPSTAGIPIAALILSGTALVGTGLKIKKRK